MKINRLSVNLNLYCFRMFYFKSLYLKWMRTINIESIIDLIYQLVLAAIIEAIKLIVVHSKTPLQGKNYPSAGEFYINQFFEPDFH